MASADPPPSRSAGRLWTVLKWALCLIVLAFVAQRGAELWRQDELERVEFSVGWLVLAAAAYLVGWLPSLWFWRALLQRLGGNVGMADAARAYYCGHLGKYIPGKATVLVIRSGMLRERGSPVSVSALTATYETLLMIGAGLALAIALAPRLLSESTTGGWSPWLRQALEVWWLPPLIVLGACLLLLPVLSELLTYFAVRMTPRGMMAGDRSVRIGKRLLATGLAAFVAGWALHGLSLGLTLRAIGRPLALADWPLWTGAVSLSTVVGFFAIFAPGGMGVREGLLIETLQIQPHIGPQQAVVASVFLRLVWLAAELLTAAALYYLVPARTPRTEKTANEGG